MEQSANSVLPTTEQGPQETKRGPKDGQLAHYKGQLAPLKDADPKEVLDLYLAEKSTKEIAEGYGVTRSALNQWLLKTVEDDWKQAQVLKALKRKEDAEDAIETAPDALSLARARESLKAAQWDLERVCRRIYGTDQPPETGRVTISLNLGVAQTPQIAVQHGNNGQSVIEGQSQVVDK